MSIKEITENKRKDISSKNLKGKKSYLSDLNLDLDMKFEKALDDICANCRYDVKFREGQKPLFEEFKSYNSETWSKIANDKGFIKQFESYLQEVDEIKDLAYMINSNKANINEVKQAFKELFKNKKDELFEIILKNNTLKNNLLGEGLTKSEAKNVFGDLINSTDSVLYNFIKF